MDEGVPYGYCPQCGEPGVNRERSPNGNTTCNHGHLYRSTDALSLEALEEKVRREDLFKGGQFAAYNVHERPKVAQDRETRIEALRAAAPIVASEKPANYASATYTLDMAEQFAKWLEKGER